MRLADCNARQKKAYTNIFHAANWLIGGLENAVSDNPEGSPEHESAKAQLADHEGLVNQVYDAAITDVYAEGACFFGNGAASFLKDIRFCGKDWLMERCEARVKKCGY